MEARRILIALALFLIISGCRTVKRTQDSQVSERKLEQSIDLRSKRQILELLQYGDTLRGLAPIVRDGRPQRIQAESTGVALEITLTDSTISYQVTAKPVAKESLKIETEDVQGDIRESEQTRSETKQKEVKSSGFPWWLYLIGALILVGWLAYKYYDITNPLLIWQKLIRGLRR